MKTQIRILSNQSLSQENKQQMWVMYKRFYNYSKEAFMQRFAKNNYYAIYYQEKQLVGFSGLRIQEVKMDKRNRIFIYFGQTIVDPAFRGKSLMRLTGIKLLGKFLSQIITSEIYFWADSLTYKAYLSFCKSADNCFPSRKQNVCADKQKIMDFLGKTNYGDNYCPKTYTVKKDQIWVNDSSVSIDNVALKDPDVQFFVNSNPNYAIGHGLITVIQFNFKDLYLSLMRHAQKKWANRTKVYENWKTALRFYRYS